MSAIVGLLYCPDNNWYPVSLLSLGIERVEITWTAAMVRLRGGLGVTAWKLR